MWKKRQDPELAGMLLIIIGTISEDRLWASVFCPEIAPRGAPGPDYRLLGTCIFFG
jgi:hypothetical protein